MEYVEAKIASRGFACGRTLTEMTSVRGEPGVQSAESTMACTTLVMSGEVMIAACANGATFHRTCSQQATRHKVVPTSGHEWPHVSCQRYAVVTTHVAKWLPWAMKCARAKHDSSFSCDVSADRQVGRSAGGRQDVRTIAARVSGSATTELGTVWSNS